MEELPSVSWAHKTTPRHSTRETPFSMTYGAKDAIPMETELPTSLTDMFEVRKNDQLLCKQLDLVEESRDAALVRLANYQ